MTAPGSTTVYKDSKGNEFISDPLGKEQLADAKNRFLGNLEKQEYEQELLLEAVKAKIPAEYVGQITSADLMNLITNNSLIISIDN